MEGADASEIQEKHYIIFFQFSFFCQVFYSRPLERGCLLRYSTADSPATPHSDHSTGPETAGSRNIPSIG